CCAPEGVYQVRIRIRPRTKRGIDPPARSRMRNIFRTSQALGWLDDRLETWVGRFPLGTSAARFPRIFRSHSAAWSLAWCGSAASEIASGMVSFSSPLREGPSRKLYE